MNTESQKSFLKTLVDIINSSAEVIEDDRRKRGELDLNLFDLLTISSSKPSKEALKATQSLIGAANMIAAAVSKPLVYLRNFSFGYVNQASLRVAIHANIADIIPKDGSGISALEISQKTGIQQEKLVRVLRNLCNHFIFCEVQLEGSKASLELYNALTMPEYSHSEASDKTSLNIAFNCPGTYFDYIKTKGNEHLEDRMEKAMRSKCSTFLSSICLWNSLKEGDVFVDVGGGLGHVCLELSKLYQNVKYIVQDQPQTIKKAEKSECPKSLKDGKTILQSHDFFTENPVKGAAIYFLRQILHDWPDDKAIEILKNIRVSMSASSKVVAAEYLVMPPARLEDTTSPWPLLGNNGCRYPHQADLQMLVLLNGKERSKSGYQDLFEKAGLKLVEVIESFDEGGGEVLVGIPADI